MNPIKKSNSKSELGNRNGRSIQNSVEKSSKEQTEEIECFIPTATESSGITPGIRIAAYARVSTQMQEKDETVSSQLRAIEDYVDKHGSNLRPEDTYIDEGFSGSTLIRPQLDKLRDRVAEGIYEKVLIYDPDRIARSYVYQMLLLEEFEQNACRLVFIRRPIGKTPDEQLLLQMQGVIAEYERAKITERTRRGKLHRMRQGEVVTGRRTFGYRYISRSTNQPAHFEVIEEEAEMIRKIYAWFTQERVSLRKIAARLNAEGISTVRGNGWYASNLGYLLKNSMYMGCGYSNKVEAVYPKDKPLQPVYRKYPKTGKKQRSRDQWHEFSCPVIIDKETFELAQLRLEENKRLSSRRTQKEYLLRGLVVCESCTRHMIAVTQSARYVCSYTRPVYAADHGMKPCSNKSRFPVEIIDKQVWQEVEKLIKRPAFLKRQYKRLSGKIVPKATGSRTALESKQQKLQERIKRTNSLFINGILTEAEHREKYQAFKDQLHKIKTQIQNLNGEQLEQREIEQLLTSFSVFSRTIKEQAGKLNFSEKRKIVEKMVKKVIFGKNTVTIEFAAPLTRNVLCTTNTD